MNDDDPVELPTGGGFTKGMGFYALIAAAVPFFIHLEETRTENGVIVSYSDMAAVVGGGAAGVLGGLGLMGAIRDRPRDNKRLGLSLLALVLGAYHLVRGMGLLI